jgi:NAD(P)-dependent dehydrogenase (short-subunit alcohol dehydrogenase family)
LLASGAAAAQEAREMHDDLNQRVALVTGGGLGIGRESALALARAGAKVVIVDIDEQAGEETASLARASGAESIFIKADVAHAADVEAMIEETVETFGRLDCAINNAGIQGPVYVPTADYDEEDWDRVIEVNLKGVWLCLKFEIKQMLQQNGGTIVNMSSAAGIVGGSVTGPAYVASKHGVVGLTRAAALEYASYGIRVNAVCPGMITTRMSQALLTGEPGVEEALIAQHPIARAGMPEEVAEAVIWLCSKASSFVTGHALAVDGGYVAQ